MARIFDCILYENQVLSLQKSYVFDMLLRIILRRLADRESVKFSGSAENFGRDGRKRLENGFCGCLCHDYFCAGTNLTEDWFV